MQLRFVGVPLLAFCGALFLYIAPAAAELLVISSTVPKYRIGASISNDELLEVQQGKQLKLQRIENKKTYTVRGPFKGKLSEYRETPEASPGPALGGSMGTKH
jgi:hypothetical protein